MLELFFSYSHHDEVLRNELEVHLAMLKRQGVISTWHDRRIVAGEHLDRIIDEHLEQSRIILLLVSPYFLASDYCYDNEMSKALERHQAGEARVIPVILHPCEWQQAPFGKLRATPTDGKPVSKFANQHEAFLQVTRDIREAAVAMKTAERVVSPAPSRESDRVGDRASVKRPAPRSSNLRIRREFSDHDRAQFLVEAIEYLANFFENSLQELGLRSPGVKAQFRRIDANRFTAAIFRGGHHLSSCTIWISNDSFSSRGGEIRFSNGLNDGSSFNQSISVRDDGYTLGFTSLFGFGFGERAEEFLSLEGAADEFWSLLLKDLQ